MDGGFPSENPTRESHQKIPPENPTRESHQRIPPENPIRLLNRYPANNRWWHRSNVVSWYFMAWCDHQFVLINSDGFYWLIQPFGSAWRFGTWTLEDPTDPCGASTWRTTPSWSSAFPTRPTRNAFDHFPFFLVVFLAFCGWFYLQFSSVLSLHSFDSLLYRPVVVCFIIHRRWVDEGRRYAPLTALLYFSIIHYAALDRVECNWFILLQWLMHHRIRLFIKHLTRALRQRWVIVIPSYLFIIINLLFFFVCVFLILLPGDLNPMTWCPSECSLRRTPSGNSLKKTNAITEWIVNGSCRLVDIPSSTCPYVNCTVCISSFVLAFYYYYLFWSRSLCFRSAFDLLSIRFRSDRRGFVSLEASG